jgi:hypothetical protein
MNWGERMIAGVEVLKPNGDVERFKVGERYDVGKVIGIRTDLAFDGIKVDFDDGESFVFPRHRVLLAHIVPDKESS